MKIEFTPRASEGVERHIQVSVPAEAVKDAEDKAARRYASTVRLPGFRPGKAPATVVRKKFGEAIRQEALESLVREAYQEFVEKESIKVAAEGKSYPLVLGAGQAIPGIEALIMELTPGGTAERAVKWPDDFPDETERGQTKTVRVTLNEVKRKSAPPLDDALAREVGDFESLAALRQAVRSDLERHAEHEIEANVRQQLIDQIIAANAFDVPKSWVQQFVKNYAEAYQVPEDQREQFAGEFRAMAERQIKRDLVIETIAEREGLAATEKDLDDRIAEQAERRAMNPGQIDAQLEKR